MAISRELRARIVDRAGDRCEYCQMPQEQDLAHFEIDHVRPLVHGGSSDWKNLAWACFRCNNRKAANLAGIDPISDQVTPLFHPRQQIWNDHFEWHGGMMVGTTPTGRATLTVLTINDPSRLALREELMASGLFSPPRFDEA